MHSATAYCEQCKKNTWLCSPPTHVSSATLNEAVVEFRYNLERARAVNTSLATVQKHNGS